MSKIRYTVIFSAILMLALAGLAPAQFVASPTALTFSVASGASAQQTLTLTGPAGTQFGAGPTTVTGSGWLAVTPTVGTLTNGTAQVSVTVNAAVLALGTYYGNITFVNNSIFSVVQVVANVTAGSASPLTVSPNPIAISVSAGSTTAQSSTSMIQNTGTTLVSFNLEVAITANAGCPLASISVAPQAVMLNPGSSQAITIGMSTSGFTSSACSGLLSVNPTVGAGFTVPITVSVAANAQLTSTPASLSFSYQLGSGNFPQNQSFTLNTTNNSVVPLTIQQVTSPNGWLVLGASTASTGPNATPILAAISGALLNALPAGTYNGSIVVTSLTPGAVINSPLTIPVTLTISSSPLLTVTPSTIPAFNYSGAQTPDAVAVTVSTTGTPISFTALAQTQTGAWLSVTPATGIASLALPASVSIQVLPTGLTAGTYSGSVVITAPGAGNTPITIGITLNVTTTAQLTLNPSQVVFNYQVGQNQPPAQVVSIGSNAMPLLYTIDPSAVSWLNIYGQSSSTPGTMTLGINTAGLTAQNTSTQVVLRAAGAGNTPLSLPVLLNVSNTPLFNVDKQSLTFQASAGSAAQTQLLSVTSTSATEQIQFSVNTGSAVWLSVSPGAGASPSNLVVRVDPTQAIAGSQTTKLRITQVVGGVFLPNFIDIPVTLNISNGTLGVSSNALSFTQVLNGAVPAAQTVHVTSSAVALNYSTSVTTDNGVAWLTASPATGSTPSDISVQTNGNNLVAGTYIGRVTIASPNAGGSPQTITVTLTVSAPQAMVSPSSLTFSQNLGGIAAAPQTVSLSSSGVTLAFAAATSGASWLSVTPTASTTPGTLTVSVNTAGLNPGTYAASITLTVQGASNQTISIPVSFAVASQQSLLVSPSSMVFNSILGATAAPAAQTFTINSSGSAMTFTAATSGGNWLTVSALTGTTPATLEVSVNPASLGVGTFSGVVNISAPGATNTPQMVNVTLNITAIIPSVTSILNAASYAAGAVSPGEIIYISGTNLGPTTLAGGTVTAGFVDTKIAATRILFDNVAAPLLYVSSTQAAVVVPYEVASRVSTNMTIEFNGQTSPPVGLRVTDAAVGIFTVNAQGTGPAAILNQDNTLNSAQHPAPRGSYIAFFATGEGQTASPGVTGKVIPVSGLTAPLLPVRVIMSGRTLTPLIPAYAGSLPTGVAGAMQVNVQIPLDAPSGPQTLVLQVGTSSSQANVTVMVQ